MSAAKYGLLGEKLGHSYSVPIHNKLGNPDYALFQVAPEALDSFMRSKDFLGINVTIPYKKAVIPYCDELSDSAKNIGSVNTIIRRKDGTLFADNTDYYGFLYMAKGAGVSFSGKKTLVFGSGGTSLMAFSAAQQCGGTPVVISRHGENNYGNLEKHFDAEIIINTTPVGMFPNVSAQITDLEKFKNCRAVLDVVYNPEYTRLLLQAKELEIPHAGGMDMLVAQAKKAEELFFNKEIDDDVICQISKEMKADNSNIVLIGMPGSGKSTIGALLAERLDIDFVDVDDMIVSRSKMEIPEIFRLHGEGRFREIESEIISELGLLKKTVISTGGGAILREENYNNLKMNGTIVFLQRRLDILPSDNRPLSSSKEAIAALYRERLPIYLKRADIVVDNNGDQEEPILHILEGMK